MTTGNRAVRLVSGLALGAALIFPAQARPAKLPAIACGRGRRQGQPAPRFQLCRLRLRPCPAPRRRGDDRRCHRPWRDPRRRARRHESGAARACCRQCGEGQGDAALSQGRTQITEVLRITRSDIVLDGAGNGPGGSELWFPRPLKLIDQSHDYDELREYLVREKKQQVEPEHNIDYLFTEYTLGRRDDPRRARKDAAGVVRRQQGCPRPGARDRACRASNLPVR